MKIYIHAGFHKTGSTNFQLAAIRASKKLAENGIFFPVTGYREWTNRKGLATSGHQDLGKNPQQFFCKVFDEIHNLKNQYLIKAIIVSNENLIHPFSQVGFYRLLHWVNANSDEHEIKIFFSNRNVSQLYHSHINEIYANERAKLLLPPYELPVLKSNGIRICFQLLKKYKIAYHILDSVDIFEKNQYLFAWRIRG